MKYVNNETDAITRVELIDHTEKGAGREFVRYYDRPVSVETDIQDEGRTVKIFISKLEPVEQRQDTRN